MQLVAAETVASMELTRPDVLRCVAAHVPLSRCAGAFRTKELEWQQSAECEQLEAFWSHSWHGARWKKIITLMLLYNGRAAIVAGCSVGVCNSMYTFLFYHH